MSNPQDRTGRPVEVTAAPVDGLGYVNFRDAAGVFAGYWRPDPERKVSTPVFVVAAVDRRVETPAPHMTSNGLMVGRARTAATAAQLVEVGLGVVALGLVRRDADPREWQASGLGPFLSVRQVAPLPGDKGRRWVAELDCAEVGRRRTWFEAARLLADRIFQPDVATV